MNVLGYMQRIGRALMVPVATLPAAAIMMGLGYWIDPVGWGSQSALAALLIKAGAAIIDNMPVLFAIGVSYGMSRDKDGAAALAGLVGFLVLTLLLSPAAVAQIERVALTEVPKAFTKINNQFIGILTGVIAAELYNRFSQVQLHKALAFFSGRRLVPIITSFTMILLAFVLMFVWPMIYDGLVVFGMTIKDLGAVGAGIYGFFNRLLIPIGLHHALNSVFWFDVAGINDIPIFLGGAKSLAEGTATLGVTGMYQAGFFPIMMFGLPGAALAIYQTARPGSRERVASIMIAAAFASFFTGVTEPLEFSFMFAAPVLYFAHAVLTGISVYIAAAMHWIAGFGFSAGLVDLILSTRNPLAVKWYMLIVQGLVFFAIYYVIFLTAIRAFNLRTPGREDDADLPAASPAAAEPASQKSATKTVDASSPAAVYLAVAGGKENLTNIDACITRLRLSVVDASRVDDKAAKAAGASGVIRLDTHSVQIIIGPEAEVIAQGMRDLCENEASATPSVAPASTPAVSTPVTAAPKPTPVLTGSPAEIYLAVAGGKENLTNIDACITRLRLSVVDASRVDDKAAKAAGAVGIIRLDANNVQIIIGPQAESIAQGMRDLCEKS